MGPLKVEEYLKFLRTVRAPETVDTYRTGVHRFQEFSIDKEYTPNTLQDFVGWLVGRGFSPATIDVYLIGVHSYMAWAKRTGMDFPEQHELVKPRLNKRAAKIIAETDLREFMVGARDLAEPYRSALMILPLTGLRVSEACNLRLTELMVVDGGYVFHLLNTKGKKDRYVPLLKSGVEFFTEYLHKVRPCLPGDVWVFPSPKGSKFGKTPIHPRSLQDYMKEIRRQRNLNFTPHTLRHVYATILKRNKVPDLELMKILGQKSLDITNQYVHLSTSEISDSVKDVQTPWADDEGDDDDGK